MECLYLEKYKDDSALYDFDCTALLAPDEVIDSVAAPTCWPTFAPPEDANNLVFGVPLVNVDPITYPDGVVMAPGKGFQVQISAGAPSTATSPRSYAVLAVITTSEGNVMTARARLVVLAPGLTS